jgi:hypothetical protein
MGQRSSKNLTPPSTKDASSHGPGSNCPTNPRPPWLSSTFRGGFATVAGVHLGICHNRNLVLSLVKLPINLYLSAFGLGAFAYVANRVMVAATGIESRIAFGGRSFLSRFRDGYLASMVKPVPFAVVTFLVGYVAASYSPRWLLNSVLESSQRLFSGYVRVLRAKMDISLPKKKNL